MSLDQLLCNCLSLAEESWEHLNCIRFYHFILLNIKQIDVDIQCILLQAWGGCNSVTS